jgi:hypothetical protein
MLNINLTFPHRYEVEVVTEYPTGNQRIFYFSKEVGHTGSSDLALQVSPTGFDPWIGAFAYGRFAFKANTGIYSCPHDGQLCVVARGNGIIIPVDTPDNYIEVTDTPIMDVMPIIERDILVFATPWRLLAYNSQGIVWRTPRIAIDGFKIVKTKADRIDGEVDDLEFTINLENGQVEGGMQFDD